MTDITYSYEIIRVDEAARCMEIVYMAEGHETMHIGARLPYTDETVEAVVSMYAPTAYWREKQAAVLPVPVGHRGSLAGIGQRKTTPAEQLAQLEAATLLPRPVRELLLESWESQFTPEQLAADPRYQRVKAVDAQAAVLREAL